MQATAWAFRIIRARDRYKGAAGVGAETTCHLGDLDVTLTLGAVPEEYLDAYARINASLDYFTGNVQTVVAAPPPPEWVESEEVYTSIKVAMTVEVEPHPSRGDNPYFWYSEPSAELIRATFRQKARATLDGVTGVLLGRVGGDVIDETLHTSSLFLTAPGKPAQGLLETRVAGRAIHFGELSDIPISTIQALNEADFARMRTVEPLGRWLALAQTEADPFKKFLWAFAGLEVASKKLAGVTKGQLVSGLVFTVDENHISGDALREIVWPSPSAENDAIERDPQRNTVFYFATMALICYPETANRDVATFKQLQGLRNRIHGSYLGIDEARKGADESIALLRRYIPEASKRLL